MSDLSRGYLSGVLVMLGISMGIQDWMGLEAYLAYARSHWVEMPWTIGALICLFGLYVGRRV